MKKSEIERIDKFISPYRVTRGKGFRLKDFDPGDTGDFKSEDKADAREMLARAVRIEPDSRFQGSPVPFPSSMPAILPVRVRVRSDPPYSVASTFFSAGATFAASRSDTEPGSSTMGRAGSSSAASAAGSSSNSLRTSARPSAPRRARARTTR